MDKVSIIVPIYNVEGYLSKCLDSIIRQTYSNIEIILVNDGSTDNCLEICNNYKKKDRRIVVIDKENGGLSEARNTGIEISTGKYIMFIDSDDWISINMVEKLYDLIYEANACIAQCDFIRVYDEKQINTSKEKEKIMVMNNRDILKRIYDKNGVKNTVVWNKLYSKKLFDNIRFPVGKLHEDEFTTYKILDSCTKIIDTNEIMYYYRQREGSIVNSEFNIKKLDVITAIEERIDYFNKKGYKDLELYARIQLLNLFRSFYVKIYDSNIENKDCYLKNILYYARKYYFRYIVNNCIDFKSKLIITLFIFTPRIYYIIYKNKLGRY